jgi:hypothetical protein
MKDRPGPREPLPSLPGVGVGAWGRKSPGPPGPPKSHHHLSHNNTVMEGELICVTNKRMDPTLMVEPKPAQYSPY